MTWNNFHKTDSPMARPLLNLSIYLSFFPMQLHSHVYIGASIEASCNQASSAMKATSDRSPITPSEMFSASWSWDFSFSAALVWHICHRDRITLATRINYIITQLSRQCGQELQHCQFNKQTIKVIRDSISYGHWVLRHVTHLEFVPVNGLTEHSPHLLPPD